MLRTQRQCCLAFGVCGLCLGCGWCVGWLGGCGEVGCLGVLYALVFSSRTLSVGADVGERMMRGEFSAFQDCLFEVQSIKWGL